VTSYGYAIPERANLNTGYKKLDSILRVFTTAYWIAIQVPAHGIKVYPPVILLATSAAFASAQFAAHANVFVWPLNWFQAISFEWVYIGTLAMSATKRGKWFYTVLVAGALTSVVYIVLYAALKYNVWAQLSALLPDQYIAGVKLVLTVALVLAHGIPLTLVNIVYTFLIHQHTQEIAARHYCPYGCGAFFDSERAMSGHKAHCVNKK
jgi:hypothetical protein